MNTKSIQKDKAILDAKAASAIAKQYYEDIAGEGDYRLALEETELSDDEKYWYITLGIYTPTTAPIFLTQGFREQINYKIIKIDANTGRVLSMKMRQYPLATIGNANVTSQ